MECFESFDWIHLVQDRVQWQDVVNTVTKGFASNRRRILGNVSFVILFT